MQVSLLHPYALSKGIIKVHTYTAHRHFASSLNRIPRKRISTVSQLRDDLHNFVGKKCARTVLQTTCARRPIVKMRQLIDENSGARRDPMSNFKIPYSAIKKCRYGEIQLSLFATQYRAGEICESNNKQRFSGW